jgi:NAD(P)-dependent dehydrogenase (short-subunit alcohol dehydrogenase family)
MDLQLAGKVAIVTGASRGIGRAIARTLAAEGMRLAVVGRSRDLLEEVAASLGANGLVHALDLREAEAPASMVAAAVAHFGRLDVLVNNAGATKRGDFLALPDADWEDGFRLKFFGAMRACRAAWPHLQATHGTILNIIGIGGRTATADFTIGGTVNAALMNLTKALADRGVQDGVRVNAINPGGIGTERLQVRLRSFAADHGVDIVAAGAEMARALGIARFGEPDEIARVVAFLVSPQATFCQGAIVDVDGGQTRTL